jgi:transcriptional regulator with XRE-family HTH domain
MCSVYYHIHTMNVFGTYIRELREQRRQADPGFSVRQLAGRIGVEPSYLSKVERGETPPPSEAKIRALAAELGEDADVLLAMAGKVSDDLLEVIRQRPQLFASLLRELKDMPEHAVLRLVREVRDGHW